MIYITGDTHQDFRRFKSFAKNEGQNLTKNDYMIILGDFGLIWDNIQSKEEINLINKLNSYPWTTLFIDGNHENFDRLEQFKEISMFGSKVGNISDSIYHLKRGNIYTIHNKTFFCFGGGISIDKIYRAEFISWWKQEMPNYKEMAKGMKSLRNCNWIVDYILTHDAPASLYEDIGIINKVDSNLPDYLNFIKETAVFKKWYFGHFHHDQSFRDNKYKMLYEGILKLDHDI